MISMLSIIVPCYNEEATVALYYEELKKYLPELGEYELLFVNDGSKDETLKKCLEIKAQDSNCRIIDFSRNFGKEAAMLAGMSVAKGDYVVITDADLQDPPKLLPEMLKILKADEHLDSVATYRVNRKGEPVIRSFFARCFYKLINKMIDINIVDGARDYRMMTSRMVKAVLSLSEVNRFSKGIFAWVGFETKFLEYENVERAAGETKWSFWKLFRYALDGIVGFTTIPLRLATIAGLLVSAFGFIYMIYIVIKALAFGDPVAGFPSLIVIITLLGGIQLIVLGILGEYLAKTYMETKRRPVYIIRDIL
ncbi:MAG: glycosyltransferase family 2 protein [Erysipelotrichaceae bacterium]|nr:glycosyltransferase family 2 protein [Erysipelotrichaceae bacterium]